MATTRNNVYLSTDRTSVDLLPNYYRTNSNKKFLGSTIDQLINPGQVDSISSYLGRKITPAYKYTDSYLPDVSNDRQSYQLEPSLIINDSDNNVKTFISYNDYINQLNYFGGITDDHNVLNQQEFYSWNPHINFDKFTNYRNYYWLPNGPAAITVEGQSIAIVKEYTITVDTTGSEPAYVFTPDGLTDNPTITLYRGQTYIFNVNCPGQPIAFSLSKDLQFNYQLDTTYNVYDLWTGGVSANTQYVETGIITFVVPDDAPSALYYVSQTNINTSGIFNIQNISEATAIDVENEIIGMVNYTMSNGVALSNGMKINFIGNVTPTQYASDNWYVEGVGSNITLISEISLNVVAPLSQEQPIEFDTDPFDTAGFDVTNAFLNTPEYITINRASSDKNAWSRFNRWFHISVIKASAEINNALPILSMVAQRPIIEFDANLQLYQYGNQAKLDVDVVDTFTSQVFQIIEGSAGYNIDNVQLIDGMRVLFTNDSDPLVNNRIFTVSFIDYNRSNQITLVPTVDTYPILNQTVLVKYGKTYQGTAFYYNGSVWLEAQQKTLPNQAPLFDIFDITGISYSNVTAYPGTTFTGSKIFSYRIGNNYDSVLGFKVAYTNVGNLGDIVFDFNLSIDTFTYQTPASQTAIASLDSGFVLLNNIQPSYENGWVTCSFLSNQPVIREYTADTIVNYFPIDVYENSGDLTDLVVTSVLVNNVKQSLLTYTVYTQNSQAYIKFFNNLQQYDFVVIETASASPKTDVGYYKFPSNLEVNPLNSSMQSFTLGGISNHVATIAANIPGFIGSNPGINNLRDLSNIASYGTRIVQHSGSLVLPMYHLVNADANVISAIRYARTEYNKFKKNLITTATNYGIDTITSSHLDIIIAQMIQGNTVNSAFYFSDMLATGANITTTQTVIDPTITVYPIVFNFNLTQASNQAVLVYLNNSLLMVNSDYTIENSSFVNIISELNVNDVIQFVQYSSTDGCCVPPTPTKLGLYPAFEPKLYIDNTYQTPTAVIQGHDGSIAVAYGDFRDELLLEFETRIYNNLKIKYDESLVDTTATVSGFYRPTVLSDSNFNSVLRQEFLNWPGLFGVDYTADSFFDIANPYTFNYSQFGDLNGNQLPGFWRGIFKYYYDTDRPNMCPWEMLGLSIEPLWWTSVYGSAPYTSDNLLLWNDLANGIMREPTGIITVPKYSRPTLLHHIPVDESGNLVSPIEANLVTNYNSNDVASSFTFGDQAPVETAWRRSSDYAFSAIIALVLLQPAKSFSVMFDRIRQYRDETNQLIYNTAVGNFRLSNTNVIVPTVSSSITRTYTSGLINYITDFLVSKSVNLVNSYITDINSIQVNLASKLAGYTTTDNLNFLLDSRVLSNQSDIYIPSENYRVFLNKSTPVNSINYSGVIVEKAPSGYIIRGYNTSNIQFSYFQPIPTNSDSVVNIGGIAAPYVTWAELTFYQSGTVVSYNSKYYAVSITHTSSTVFESKYFVHINSLPVIGGSNITIRSKFNTTASLAHYGLELATIQEVVDFLLGYGAYLESIGFAFDYYDSVLQTVTNWQTSAKEFAYWTTQTWATGSIISLSPAAKELVFSQPYAVVDNIYDNFGQYSVLREDGLALDNRYIETMREGGYFQASPINTDNGLYSIVLNLVQKEHVVVFDNVTMFNDVVYEPLQGYRQFRIKMNGFRTATWNGDFIIPGFTYDQALISNWTRWTDYAYGNIVQYQNNYYAANQVVNGSLNFDVNQWDVLKNKPISKLIPNLDTMANQFADFYDLDISSLNLNQQKFAQHLIGYQPRSYLSNIITSEISQYNFYQGMIREKGTQNSLNKLFDALNTSEHDSIEFYEEWAFLLGQYGASNAFNEFEFLIDQNKFISNPQAFELDQTIDLSINDSVYRYTESDLYLSYSGYNNNPFPVTAYRDFYLTTPGYVATTDVSYSIGTLSEITTIPFGSIKIGQYIWISYFQQSWDVFRVSITKNRLTTLSIVGTDLVINFGSTPEASLYTGQYIGINSSNVNLFGFYPIDFVGLTSVSIQLPATIAQSDVDALNQNGSVELLTLTSQRAASIDNLNNILPLDKNNNELVWIDNLNQNSWEVWKYSEPVVSNTLSISPASGQTSICVDRTDLNLIIVNNGYVSQYYRPTATSQYTYMQQMPFSAVSTVTSAVDAGFGSSIAMSSNGDQLLIGAPNNHSNDGIVGYYVKNHTGDYDITPGSVLRPSDLTSSEQFGYNVKFFGSIAVIASQTGKIRLYDPMYNIYNTTTLVTASHIIDIAVSDNGTLAVLLDTNTVAIYSINNFTFTAVLPTITPTGSLTGISFSSIALSTDGVKLAVGCSINNKVLLFDNITGTFTSTPTPTQTLLSPDTTENEHFGLTVKFDLLGDNIFVYCSTTTQSIPTTFDLGLTTFDLNSTLIYDPITNEGTIRRYSLLGSTYVYSNKITSSYIPDSLFGNEFEVTQTLYVTDNIMSGSITLASVVSQYNINQFGWSVYNQQSPSVNYDLIKSVFLYDTRTNQKIQDLNIIDLANGKILPSVDQELTYKTPYDPALYNIGDSAVVVNQITNWTTKQIGQVWWDLSAVKIDNAHQKSVVYKTNTWNTISLGSSIDIYEWVSSTYTPAVWDSLADTPLGLSLGISGKSKYSNAVYSYKQTYDNVSQSFTTVYYFWVKNKTITPAVPFRNLSTSTVSNYILDPASSGDSFIYLLGSNQFALVNCQNLISNDYIAINFRCWTNEQSSKSLIHSQYQLFSEGNSSDILNPYIEQKWIDSLIGYDINDNAIPDPKLPTRMQYGIQSTPRQGMFINRHQALNQYISTVNSMISQYLITDQLNFTTLNLSDPIPTNDSGEYDISISSYAELQSISTVDKITAELTPVIINGKITGVTIVNGGVGYGTLLGYGTNQFYGPAITIQSTTGLNATIQTIINSAGTIVGTIIDNSGVNYGDDTIILIRDFTVLITSDEGIGGYWSLATYKATNGTWWRTRVQMYNTRNYWDFLDWYAVGYSQYTKPNFQLNFAYELPVYNIQIGQTVKINHEGSTGWVLLLKTNNASSPDTTLNYSIIGRQSGTIQFSPLLYTSDTYQRFIFNYGYYDSNPKIELRNIITAIKNDILIDSLKSNYNSLFFYSLRYVFSEQNTVDWAFKTSFVSAVHNAGLLTQSATFEPDNLSSYEEYINEVKPYHTVIRDYTSQYEITDTSNSKTSDFDLPSFYNPDTNTLQNFQVSIVNNLVEYNSDNILYTPYSDWYTAVGNRIHSIVLYDSGIGYSVAPQVIINGYSANPASAVAYLGQNGSISKVTLLNPGYYLSTPTITFNGVSSGSPAVAYAIMDNGLVRSFDIEMKFDRVSKNTTIAGLNVTETLTSTSKSSYDLTWPMNLDITTVVILINGQTLGRSRYAFTNVKNPNVTYTQYNGVITFTDILTDALIGSTITVEYEKNIDILTAFDRVKLFYKPQAGQLGSDPALVMSGIDYDGVTIDGYNFNTDPNYDIMPWMTTGYQSVDEPDVNLSGGTFETVITTGIIVDGDNFIGSIPTEPEEVYPGMVFDSVIIEVDQIATTTSQHPIGFRIFNDMLNNTTYYRINDYTSTTLSADLLITDAVINVVDGSVLSTPSSKNPGIIFIGSECIAYYQKSGNVLSQLHRGILGTAAPSVYVSGTLVQDGSAAQELPYTDNIDTTKFISNGTSEYQLIDLPYNISASATPWFRTTIPSNYGQCDDIDVFVGGVRLRKSPITVWDPNIGPNDITGDQLLEAEFSVEITSGNTNQVRLTSIPATGLSIVIQRRTGTKWWPGTTSLQTSTSQIPKFIRDGINNEV